MGCVYAWVRIQRRSQGSHSWVNFRYTFTPFDFWTESCLIVALLILRNPSELEFLTPFLNFILEWSIRNRLTRVVYLWTGWDSNFVIWPFSSVTDGPRTWNIWTVQSSSLTWEFWCTLYELLLWWLGILFRFWLLFIVGFRMIKFLVVLLVK